MLYNLTITCEIIIVKWFMLCKGNLGDPSNNEILAGITMLNTETIILKKVTFHSLFLFLGEKANLVSKLLNTAYIYIYIYIYIRGAFNKFIDFFRTSI